MQRKYSVGCNLNCGVYVFKNKTTGNFYIGQSTNLRIRQSLHFSRLLRNSKYCNRNIKRDFDLYGKNSFEFVVLVYCEKDQLNYYEQALVDRMKPTYNILVEDVTSSKGLVFTPEHRERLSKSLAAYRNANKLPY